MSNGAMFVVVVGLVLLGVFALITVVVSRANASPRRGRLGPRNDREGHGSFTQAGSAHIYGVHSHQHIDGPAHTHEHRPTGHDAHDAGAGHDHGASDSGGGSDSGGDSGGGDSGGSSGD